MLATFRVLWRQFHTRVEKDFQQSCFNGPKADLPVTLKTRENTVTNKSSLYSRQEFFHQLFYIGKLKFEVWMYVKQMLFTIFTWLYVEYNALHLQNGIVWSRMLNNFLVLQKFLLFIEQKWGISLHFGTWMPSSVSWKQQPQHWVSNNNFALVEVCCMIHVTLTVCQVNMSLLCETAFSFLVANSCQVCSIA